MIEGPPREPGGWGDWGLGRLGVWLGEDGLGGFFRAIYIYGILFFSFF